LSAVLNAPVIPGLDPALEELEIGLLLDALYGRFGLDYRSHDRALLRRRLQGVVRERALPNLSRLQEEVLHVPGVAASVVRALAVPPAALFDRPDWARRQRTTLAASLRPTALPKMWLPDVAGVGEAWTLAILLAEEKLYGRTEIFATLASDEQLHAVHDATLPLEQIALAQAGYEASGGNGRLLDYFDVTDGQARLLPRLRERITWAQYNLVTDASFNEFHAIVCCRALPGFGPVLRQRVLRLFRDSLALFGVLGVDRVLAATDAAVGDYQLLPGDGAWYKRVR